MENEGEVLTARIQLLKEARMQILRLHKDLIDIEREVFEMENGQLSSGRFLQVLLSNENFAWLRKFSMLIVEIDEMFNLDDGYTKEMVEKQFSRLNEILELKTEDESFNSKYRNSIHDKSLIKTQHNELKRLIAKKQKSAD